MTAPLVAELLERAAAEHTHDPAVREAGDPISYGRWWTGVQALAGRLADAGCHGRRVLLTLPPSVEAFTAMAACLLEGIPYVPLAPETPPLRTRAVAEACRPALVIGPPATAPPGLPCLDVAGAPAPEGESRRRRAGPGDEAFVLFTSGSTGVPKGVVITHENVSAFVRWAAGAFALGPGDRLPVCSPLSFDLAVLDVLAGLSTGATLSPLPRTALLFPREAVRVLRAERITVVYAVPTFLGSLVSRGGLEDGGIPSLRLVLYAGETFHAPLLRRLAAALPAAEVHNLYGPIETNVVTSCRLTAEDLAGDAMPIGHPLPHATVSLAEASGAPADDEGELIVAGPSVSPGYLGDDECTRAARIRSGGRVYHRTGDVARRRADGALVLLGRQDDLIKSHGHRVEPAEVEVVLLAHPGVAQAAAFAVELAPGSVAVHAAVAGDEAALDSRRLVHWCAERLPGYMVPRDVAVLDELPRTATGKIDRRSVAARARGPVRG